MRHHVRSGTLTHRSRPGDALKFIAFVAQHTGENFNRMLTQQRSDDPGLSEREWRVLEQVALGKTNAQIAEALHVSANTVRFHLKNIFEKLHVANRTEATAWYFENRVRFMGKTRQR